MKKVVAFILAITGWFAVIAQYVIAIQKTEFPILTTLVNVSSFFTILTNGAMAAYFTCIITGTGRKWVGQPGSLTAMTVYMTVVGLTYQVALRGIWDPQGMQKLVDELLHSVLPLAVIFYWAAFEDRAALNYRAIPRWLVYPLVYLIYTLIRGYFMGVYPYPFIDITKIGLPVALRNSLVMTLLFTGLSLLYIFIGRRLRAPQPQIQ